MLKYFTRFLHFVFLTLSPPYYCFSQTIVGGLISSNTTWNILGSPYVVQNQNIIVDPGVTLTIDAGVTVKFNAARSIQIDGTLRAIGTSSDPIIFTANSNNPSPGFWGFILINNSSTPYNFADSTGTILKYCNIEYAGGVNVNNNAALRLDNARPYIDNCIIRYSSKQAIRVYNLSGNLFINGCTIENNTSDTGIVCFKGASSSRATIINSTISNNTSTLASNNYHYSGGIYTISTNLSIINCNITNNVGAGLWGLSTTSDTISGSVISYNTYGIYYPYNYSNNYSIIINGSTINNNTKHGIYFLYADYKLFNSSFTLTGNNISNNGQNGLLFYTITIDNCTFNINNNLIENNGLNGIELILYNSTYSDYSIMANAMNYSGSDGLYIKTTNTEYNNFHLNWNYSFYNSYSGIYFYLNGYEYNNNIFDFIGNVVIGNMESGIIWDESVMGNLAQPNTINIAKNKIFNNESSRGGGLKIIGFTQTVIKNFNIDQNIIAGNKVTGEGGGIYIDVMKGNTVITNNSIINNYAPNSSALSFNGPSAITFNYNTIVWNKSTDSLPANAVNIQTKNISTNHQFRYNNIYNSHCSNPFYELLFAGANNDSLNARNCYWQKNTLTAVNDAIYDYLDSSSLGRVFAYPFDTVPNIYAPVTPVRNVQKTDLGGGNVQISWDPNTESDIAGYKIYWGNPTGYSFSNSLDVGNNTTHTFTGGLISINDTIEITAYDSAANGLDDQVEGNESWFKGDDSSLFVPVSLSSNTDMICADQSITFNAHGGNTYQFFINGIPQGSADTNNVFTANSLENGDSVWVNAINGCGSMISSPIIVNVVNPSISLGSDTNLCLGDTFFLDCGKWLKYEWNSGDTLSTINVISSGTYSVTITDSLGCSATDTITIIFEACSGINDFYGNYQFQIFPNPIDKKSIISFYLPEDSMIEIKLINLIGQEVRKFNSVKYGYNKIQILDEELPQGIYIIQLDLDGKKILSKKFVYMATY